MCSCNSGEMFLFLFPRWIGVLKMQTIEYYAVVSRGCVCFCVFDIIDNGQKTCNQLTKSLSKDSLSGLSKETVSAHGTSVCSL